MNHFTKGWQGFCQPNFVTGHFDLMFIKRHIKFTSIYTEIVLKFEIVQDLKNFNWTMSWNLGKNIPSWWVLDLKLVKICVKSNYLIRPQCCTCHNQWAVIARAKLWCDLISRNWTVLRRIFTRFQNELINPLWTGFPGGTTWDLLILV